jgi:hypothetical protein
MEGMEKFKEIEDTVVELKKLRESLWIPTERLYRLRKEIASSFDFLEGLCKTIKRATKKNFELTVGIASSMDSANDKILDKFFERAIFVLDEVKKEIQERWKEIKELKSEKVSQTKK